MVVVSIQARMGSSRLPGKVLLQLGERRIIEHVVDRVRGAAVAANIAVTTGDRTPNDAIREWCRRASLRYETGPEENLLERHRHVGVVTDSDLLVRITADCPFVPSAEIERVLDAHQNSDARYTTNVTAAMPVGTGVDVIDTDVLAELAELGDTHPVNRLHENPDSWNRLETTTQGWTQYSDVHLAVDTPADYWQLTDAVEAVGTDPRSVADVLFSKDSER